MGILTADMARVVHEQRLAYIATVCPDGSPNLSPKATTYVWDDDHLIFANIRSPQTIANLRQNPMIEINVVDPIIRRGYRFKGRAEIHSSGPIYEAALQRYRENGLRDYTIDAVVLIAVERAVPVTSPAYDHGATESSLRQTFREYYEPIFFGLEAAAAAER